MRLKFGKWPGVRQKTDNTGVLNAPKKLAKRSSGKLPPEQPVNQSFLKTTYLPYVGFIFLTFTCAPAASGRRMSFYERCVAVLRKKALLENQQISYL